MIHRRKQLAAVWVLAACTSVYCQSPMGGPLNLNRRDMAAARLPADSGATSAIGGPRRITLEQAQQQAAAANDTMAHLAQLQVEAARQHRLGAESDYFPKISSTLANFHFNKFMGEQFTVVRPMQGGTTTEQIPLVGKDQTLIAVTAAQPVTVGIELGRARLSGGGLPASPFRLRGGFTIPPWPRFPRPPYNAGLPDFPGPV